jgi:hypothetical protein
LLFGLFACDAYHPKAFISPRVQTNKKSVEMGAPVEVRYIFETSQDYPGLKKDLTVFVHFLDAQGIIRFVDDHAPPQATNQWKAGSVYSYTRTIFIPENIPSGGYTIELGMYTPSGKGERFALNAKRLSERSYDVGEIRIIKPHASSEPKYVEGWYQEEREPNDDWYHWRWISRLAVLKTSNPRADSILYLKADTDSERFTEPPIVRLSLNQIKIDEFPIEGSEPTMKKYPVSKAQLGEQPEVELKIEVDKTFVPASDGVSTDKRQLGIRVYSLYLGKAQD